MSQRYQGGILGVGFNPLQAPNAPTIGTATAGNQNVSVAFTAPANVGGSAISSYRVLANPGGIGATGSSSPVTVSGLTNGTTYTFSLAAVNSYGFSPYSGTATATPTIFAVEDVFSTWLYTGNSSTQTITNGINLSGQGGMVWQKGRSGTRGTGNHYLFDTSRGALQTISSNTTEASYNRSDSLTAFNSNGFTLGSNAFQNETGTTFASWTFRESPNFFDVVTWTGNGVAGRQIAHNLGVTPGCIMYKCTSTATSWLVLHRGLPNGFSDAINLNTTDPAFSLGASFAPTATTFTMSNGVDWNQNGQTYVAYLYAHDTASDGIIQCGSYAGTGAAGQVATLGWEPQWVMIKATNTATDWQMYDNMRGMTTLTDGSARLRANATGAEITLGGASSVFPTATGFGAGGGIDGVNQSGGNYIYIAIRRGPMRTPTVGTSVFKPDASTSTGGTFVSTGFPVDAQIIGRMFGAGHLFVDKLRGASSTTTESGRYLQTTDTLAEASGGVSRNWSNVGYDYPPNFNGQSNVMWSFRRAPGFFDEVCYTGTGVARTVNHNLGVAPELIITKSRSNGTLSWNTYAAPLGNSASVRLNTTDAAFGGYWNSTSPTSTVFSLSSAQQVNENGGTYVAYLFASAPGVSKVGSYTGTGALQTINCAFTTGSRFVMIKRTDSTGDWYVWDSARGIVAGNDPYLLLNSTAAEVTGTNYVDTTAVGFQVTAAAPAGINASGGTYIFLAIS